MAKTICARCGESGGRFRLVGDNWVHVGRCSTGDKSRNGTHANWPLVTSHVGNPNDGPMVIENLSHLRRVEKEYGISSDAYNNDSSNRTGEGERY